MFTLSFLMTGYSFQNKYHAVLWDVRALIRDKTLVLAPFLLNEMIEIRRLDSTDYQWVHVCNVHKVAGVFHCINMSLKNAAAVESY